MPASMVWLVIAALALGAAAPPAAQQAVGRLRVELTLNKSTYLAGEPVEARLVVRVEGDGAARLQFRSGQRFDLIIRRQGILVWRWSHDKAFTQAVEEVTLRPGETLTFRAAWDQLDLQGRRIDPGEYEAQAIFLGRTPEVPASGIETPPIAFRIRG